MFFFSKWSYYLNMAGSEFPMHDLDDFFSKIKIPFSIESYASPGRKIERWTYKYNETSARAPIGGKDNQCHFRGFEAF